MFFWFFFSIFLWIAQPRYQRDKQWQSHHDRKSVSKYTTLECFFILIFFLQTNFCPLCQTSSCGAVCNGMCLPLQCAHWLWSLFFQPIFYCSFTLLYTVWFPFLFLVLLQFVQVCVCVFAIEAAKAILLQFNFILFIVFFLNFFLCDLFGFFFSFSFVYFHCAHWMLTYSTKCDEEKKYSEKRCLICIYYNAMVLAVRSFLLRRFFLVLQWMLMKWEHTTSIMPHQPI